MTLRRRNQKKKKRKKKKEEEERTWQEDLFFLIGKKQYIQENCQMQISISISKVQKEMGKQKHKKTLITKKKRIKE